MINKTAIIGSIASLGVLLGSSSSTIAQTTHETMQSIAQTGEFQHIEQPLWVKGVVTVGGLGLIALELRWFLLSRPK